ncbi:MAG: transcriptional repressor [Verrucomicrobiales bacterium]|nr:transcriptional repressor [Verrucomicrobiales bacterium]
MILRLLASHKIPLTLDQIASLLPGRCNQVTLYRSLGAFETLGLVRKITLRSRTTYFTLIRPGETPTYLVCRNCEQISLLPAVEEMSTLTRKISQATQFTRLQHELEFFGICPRCQHRQQCSPDRAPLKAKPTV